MKKIPRSLLYIGVACGLILLNIVWITWRAQSTPSTKTSVDTVITKLQAHLKVPPTDTAARVALAQAYMQEIRETADASYYNQIDQVLGTDTSSSTPAEIVAMRASVQNGRHNFKDGLAIIADALKINSTIPYFYGIKVDSEIELGKYTDAENDLQTMVDLKPNFDSYTRIAYLRELTGDFDGALETLDLAIEAGSNFKENIAWGYVEKGKLHMHHSIPLARDDFNRALAVVPAYAPALEGLGKAAFFDNKPADAVTLFLQAFQIHPLAQYAVDIADVYHAQGDNANAAKYYELARLAYDTSTKSGVNTDLEYGLFLADHGNATDATAKAQNAFVVRPSPYAADALSWALYKNNMLAQAENYSAQALVLGKYDSSILFHAGQIKDALGKKSAATAYYAEAKKINPYFSIYYASIFNTK